MNQCSSPYCELSLSATLPTRAIIVAPSHIVVPTVPLGVTIKEDFLLVMDGFAR